MINTKLLIIGTTTAVITPIAALAIVVGVRTNKDKEITVAAPALAIVGLNIKEVHPIAGTGDMSGKTYTQEQVDARDATRAPIGAVVGHNTPETTDDDFGKIGLGDGNTYTQAQIDARGATAAPATAIKGLNVKFVQGVPGDVPPKPDILATGAGDGNTYTQANLDKRTGGDKVAPIGAVIGVNIAGKSVTTPAVGDGSGKTYTQAQIDKRSRGDKVAPKDAIVGINGKETKPVKATGDGSGNTYTAAQVRLRDILKFG